MSQLVERKSWDEFRESGLLWLANRALHVFGWAIVVVVDEDNKPVEAYPARVKFRGFDPESEDEGFRKIAQYMRDKGDKLLVEAEGD